MLACTAGSATLISFTLLHDNPVWGGQDMTLAFLRLLTRRFLPPGPKLAARRLEIVGGEKKNPARENSRTDKPLCNGTSLVAVHLAKAADQFQENIEIIEARIRYQH